MRKKFIALSMVGVLSLAIMSSGCSKETNNTDNSTVKSTDNASKDAANTEAKDEATSVDTIDKSDDEILTPEWAKESVFYEIFVRSFCDGNGDGIGDFKGIASKVDYLKELGVDAVWLMPMMDSTTYHGYDVVDYYTTNPDYGTMEEFEEMLKVLHDNDIKVIIDFVVNHTSSSNKWFRDAVENENSEYKDYYFIYDEYPEGMKEIRKDQESGKYYYGHYDTIMPDLNYSNQKVRDSIKEIAGFWLDKGVDGFRLDGAKEIDIDESITHSWWKEFTSYVSEKNPKAFVVGENWNNSPNTIAPFYADMNSSFNFPLASAVEGMAGGVMRDYVTELVNARQKYQEEADSKDSVNKYMIDSTMINNHDMDRVATRLKDINKEKLAAAIFMTLPGTPFIYYGDELGQYGQSPDQFRREPFDWFKSATGQGQADFYKSAGIDAKYVVADDGISYEEEKDDDSSLFNYYKKLISIRKENPILFNGDYKTFGMNDGLYAYTISGAQDESTLLVIHNQRDEAKTFELKEDALDLITGQTVKADAAVKIDSCSTMILKYTAQDVPLNEEEFVYENEGEYKAIFNITLPENTPENEDIYIVGTFNDWNECDDRYIVERTSKTTATITLTNVAKGNIEYKFTRGSWNAREQNADGADVIGPEQKQNRNYRFDEDNTTVDVVIEHWSDIKEE